MKLENQIRAWRNWLSTNQHEENNWKEGRKEKGKAEGEEEKKEEKKNYELLISWFMICWQAKGLNFSDKGYMKMEIGPWADEMASILIYL